VQASIARQIVDAHRATWARILAAIERLQAEMPEQRERVQ
jgi:hypothetical protein